MTTDLVHVCFRDVAWLQQFSLNEATVLNYFAMSQFYERTCNNEVLKMQARYTDNEAILNQLHKMTGIEYSIIKSIPPSLFIIAKRNRTSPTQAMIISCYYVMDGSIYMAPSLYSVLSNRILSSMHYFREAIAYGTLHLSYCPFKRRYLIDSQSESNVPDSEVLRLEKLITDVLHKDHGIVDISS